MTVQELIAELSKYPAQDIVVLRGYEGGVDEIGCVEQCTIALNVNEEHYLGSHERLTEDEMDSQYDRFKQVGAVHLKYGPSC